MTPTQFWLIRHGETAWNAQRRLQGWLDIPLNPEGTRQAQQLGQFLRSDAFPHRIDAIVSSDLSRAYDTARLATDHLGLSIERCEGLRERSYGVYEGLDWASLNGQLPGGHAVNLRDPDQAVEQGETLPVFHERITRAFERIAAEHSGQNLLAFAHGGVIDVVWRRLADMPLDAARPEPILNASINQFSIDGQNNWRMVSWGMIDHLRAAALDDVI